MARNYNTPFQPYPLVSSTDVATTDTNVAAFPVPVGGLVQQKATNKVWRLVEFVVSPTADIDFAAALATYYIVDTNLTATATYQVSQDFSDTGGLPAGICQQAIDVSAHSTNLFGYIQVGGECTVTNHDTTCPIDAALSIQGADGGTTDVAAAGEAIVGRVIDNPGATAGIITVQMDGILPVEVRP